MTVQEEGGEISGTCFYRFPPPNAHMGLCSYAIHGHSLRDHTARKLHDHAVQGLRRT